MSAWPKRCTMCGQEISAAEWQMLLLCGLMDDGDQGYRELRQHYCGTTLSIPVGESGEEGGAT